MVQPILNDSGYIVNTKEIQQDVINYCLKNGGFALNLDNPRIFREKLNYLRIHDNIKLRSICADKLSVKEYVANKINSSVVFDVYQIFDNVDDFNVRDLPNKFIIKTNNGCATNIVCINKNELNITETKQKLQTFLNKKMGDKLEYHYDLIKPKIFIEKLMSDGKSDLTDYKFHCFNGVPFLCQVISDRHTNLISNFYDMSWNILNVGFKTGKFKQNLQVHHQKPKKLDLMIEYCKLLSQDFRYVRVDLYDINDNVYFGELTFTPQNCFVTYINDNYQIILGNKLILSVTHE